MNYRIVCKIMSACLLMVTTTFGQYRADFQNSKEQNVFTGNLQNDLFSSNLLEANVVPSDDANNTGNKYSPLRAGLYSAVLPGAGQFYTKSYWQSAAFFGAEVISWILYAAYENKGDDQTDIFQKYADERWSVIRYARWIDKYYNFSANDIITGTPSDDAAQPWKYVNWEKLNYYEEEIGKQHSGFSHRLAPYSDQQYYEMIGKYSQFIGGWDDAWNGSNSLYGINDVLAENVSDNFLKYRDMRGEANSFYNIATTVSYVIVANHIFSALEAAWNASRINNSVTLEGHIQPRVIYSNMVEYVPTLNAKYEF